MRQLLIRPGAIGDFLLSLPALELLCEGDCEVWVARRNVPLVRFARARAIQDTGLDWIGIPDVSPPEPLVERLRGFDRIVSWYGGNRAEFRRAVRELGLPFVFLEALPARTGSRHAADFYMDQAYSLTGKRSAAIPRLPCLPREGGFIAIHPFSGSPAKNWPLRRYCELDERLKNHAPVYWIIEPGCPAPQGAEIFPPTEDLFELACRLASARLYLGNDSGITHLAAAAGAPVLALFGPTDPAVWGPRGENRVVVLQSPAADRCMDAISPELVYEAAGGLLRTGCTG
ncbi:MAG: glycosyltransferase family 9 protein [Bryobacteraceae bacterium]